MKQNLDGYLNKLKNKTVAVLGIGVSNTPLIYLLLGAGISVVACDKKNRDMIGPIADELEQNGVELRLGADYLEDLECDVIFRTPGMRPDLPQLKRAEASGARLTSEMEVFFEICPCQIIGVTGSDGKTTTTTIISEILKAAGLTVHLGGNIGEPLLSRASKMRPEDVAVVELSSFQLMTMSISPNISVVTNITPNHLDTHKSMEEYIDAKRNIYLHQKDGDRLVVNACNEITAGFHPNEGVELIQFSLKEPVEKGIYFDNGTIYIKNEAGPQAIINREQIKLPGIHNVDNYMAAFAATIDMVPPDFWIKVAREFAGVEHRIELVRELDGVRYYNDSIASSPTRTIAGLRSFDRKVILIAGGYDKKIPFDTLGREINKRASCLILCGDTARKIWISVEGDKNYSGLKIYECNNMTQCVAVARRESKPGDIVILSPACASFDRYPNFVERGRAFKTAVMNLSQE